MNPYADKLGGRDAVAVLGDTPERIGQLVERMRGNDFARAYAPGKWNACQLLTHLAQAEMAFGMRVRLALTTDNYVVQPFDGDRWISREPIANGLEAFKAYYAMRQWNLPLFRSLTAEDRARTFTHPERGQLTIGAILEMLAGHELHHLEHLQQSVGQSG